ncbi:MAG: peptidylprolyl isomerase [Robiginitomaculum sp.]
MIASSIKSHSLSLVIALLASAVSFGANANAQNAHGIAATVNEDVITTHDLRQRVLFNIMASGTKVTEDSLKRMQAQAMRALVDERLQMGEAKKFDLSISDAEVEQSVARLAQSNNMSIEQIAQTMAKMGISLNTLRDQVRAEAAWQRIINGRFGTRIRISDSQIDEALNRITANVSKPSYLVSEIFIEGTPEIGGMAGAMEGAKAMITQANQGAPFTALARQFSSSATAAKGGDMGWIGEGELRDEIDATIQSMEKGSISDPISVPGGVYIIALRDKRISSSETVYNIKQIRVTAEGDAAMATARAGLSALQLSQKSCEGLEDAVSSIAGAEAADMGEVKSAQVSPKILAILSATDVNAISAPIEASGGMMALMVCDRKVQGAGIPSRDEVENRLMDQQLAQQAKRYLRDIRRSATIESR